LTSLEQARRILHRHRIVMLVPASLDLEPLREVAFGIEMIPTPDEFWGSVQRHDRFLKSRRLYELFADHSHVLIHHLDAYVFRDELLRWCGAGYDYVAGPFLEGFAQAGANAPLVGIGNGGFSLRDVNSFLRLTTRLDAPPNPVTRQLRRLPYPVRAGLRKLLFPGVVWLRLPRSVVERLFAFVSRDVRSVEDVFWGMRVPALLPWFRACPADEALGFGFEVQPSRMLAMTGGKLPFGCHGWPVYEPEFWRCEMARASDPPAPDAPAQKSP
jgi:hypothetical protein